MQINRSQLHVMLEALRARITSGFIYTSFEIVKRKERRLMPQKLETVLKHVEEIGNNVNRQLIKDYQRYLVSTSTKLSEG